MLNLKIIKFLLYILNSLDDIEKSLYKEIIF